MGLRGEQGIQRAARALGLAAAVVALAAAGCVKKPEAISCGTGIYCPAGSRCAARQAVCIFDGCGDGVVQPGEACDDGNILDGDGCSHDCQSTEVCGNWHWDVAAGEGCDDGNLFDGDGCSSLCQSEVCGNGLVEGIEQCDGRGETSYCNADCTISRCGDGRLNGSAGEKCDDGNTSNEDDCVQGCLVARCGDAFVDSVVTSAHHEECDLGDRVNSDNPECPYGLVSCARCSRDCRTLTPIPFYCGDGKVDWIHDQGAFEPCDATTSIDVCRTCRVLDPSRCEIVATAGATGTIGIRIPGAIADGDTLTVDDGENPPLTIEFDADGLCTAAGGSAPRRCVQARDAGGVRSAHDIAKDVEGAIVQYPWPIHVTASASSGTVRLVNSVPGVTGNRPIGRSGALVDGAVVVSGMSGGAGCAQGGPCAQDSDCVSGSCVDSVCQ